MSREGAAKLQRLLLEVTRARRRQEEVVAVAAEVGVAMAEDAQADEGADGPSAPPPPHVDQAAAKALEW